MGKADIFGKAKLNIMDNSNKAEGMGMEFGSPQISILILLKGSTLKIVKMDLEFTHGLMELFIKDHLKMI